MVQKQQYVIFREHLITCQQFVQGQTPPNESLKQAIGDLQHFFQTHILGTSPDPGHHEQAYQVEMSKQLRLLTVDLTFLQVARQEASSQQRRHQMMERLERLVTYCEAILST